MAVIAECDGNLGQSTSVKANSNSSSSSVRENKFQVSSQEATLNTARKPATISLVDNFTGKRSNCHLYFCQARVIVCWAPKT